MDRWMEIRRRVVVEGVSKRQVMAEEGSVKYARLNFMVPVPEVNSLAELNKRLLEIGRFYKELTARSGVQRKSQIKTLGLMAA